MTVFSTFGTFLSNSSNELNQTALDAFFIKNRQKSNGVPEKTQAPRMVENKMDVRVSESDVEGFERLDVVACRRDGCVDGKTDIAASGGKHADAAFNVGVVERLLATERACRMAGIDVGCQIFGATVDENQHGIYRITVADAVFQGIFYGCKEIVLLKKSGEIRVAHIAFHYVAGYVKVVRRDSGIPRQNGLVDNEVAVEEADNRLILPCTFEGRPGYLAGFAAGCARKLEHSDIVGLRQAHLAIDEACLGLCYGVAGSVFDHLEAVDAVCVKLTSRGTGVDRLYGVVESSTVLVHNLLVVEIEDAARSIAGASQQAIAAQLAVPLFHNDSYVALPVVDGVGYGGILIVVVRSKEATLHADEGRVVVLVKQAIDDRSFGPFGVGRELDLARGEDEDGY